MNKAVRRALLIARGKYADGGVPMWDYQPFNYLPPPTPDLAPVKPVAMPTMDTSSFGGGKGRGKQTDSSVSKPATTLPITNPLPSTQVNYQPLLPPGGGIIQPASAPMGIPGVGGGFPGFGGFGAAPQPGQPSLTAPFSGVMGQAQGLPDLSAFKPQLYSDAAAYSVLPAPTTQTQAQTQAPGATTDTAGKPFDSFGMFGGADSGGPGGLGGDVGSSSGMDAATAAGMSVGDAVGGAGPGAGSAGQGGLGDAAAAGASTGDAVGGAGPGAGEAGQGGPGGDSGGDGEARGGFIHERASGGSVGYADGGHVGGVHPAKMIPGIHVTEAPLHRADGGQTDEHPGIVAYHGSPHDFAAERLVQHPTGEHEYIQGAPGRLPDVPQGARVVRDFPHGRFRDTQIGTGEGFQAYGHGHYAAESEGIARGYRDTLSDRTSNFRVENVDMPKWILNAIHQAENKSETINKIKQDFSQRLLEAQEEQKNSHQPWLASGRISLAKDVLMGLGKIEQGAAIPSTKGHLYQLRIKAHPEHFLDWDKPLSEQHARVQQAIAGLGLSADPEGSRGPVDNPTGQEIYKRLVGGASEWGHTKQGMIETTKDLHAAGIPGIRYFDAGSRGAGDGTRNYVVFDPNLIDIERKYARGGRLLQDEYPTHYMPHVGRQVMRNGGSEPSSDLENYRDPESKRMAGWEWTPLSDVHKSLGSFTEIPSHVAAFGDFMNETARKAATTGLTPRDLIKAYVITRASIQREGRSPKKVLEYWPDYPGPRDKLIRPEGAMGEWLQTPMGQRYLDAAVKGNVDQEAVADAIQSMRPFGMSASVKKPGSIGEEQALPYAAKVLPGLEGKISDMVARAIHSDSAPEEWRKFATQLHGLKYAKAGFLSSMLGRGDQPTADARQYNVHSGMAPGAERNALIGKAGEDAVLRLAARQKAMNIKMPSELTPHYQHLVHHTVWDKAGNDVTTHQDIINAMQNAASGGAIKEQPIHQHLVAHAMRAAGIEGLDPNPPDIVQTALRKTTQDPSTVLRALALSRSITKGT